VRSRRTGGWGGFAVWALVGALFSLSFLGAASIGLFVLPAALVALGLTAVFIRAWPEGTGVVLGVAALLLFVGSANLHSTPCPSSGSGTVHVGRPGEGTFSCGGWDPAPWLVAGIVLAGISVGFYVLARGRE
jgi:hypothetical protein